MEINSGLFVILACVGIYIILCVLCICNKSITNLCVRTVAHGSFRSDVYGEDDVNRTVLNSTEINMVAPNVHNLDGFSRYNNRYRNNLLDVPPAYDDVCKSAETPPPPYKQLVEPTYREISKRMETIDF